MSDKAGTREEWLEARKVLLEAEKELTRRSDELSQQRQALPWVRVEQEYAFETGDGTKTLSDLFDGRSQLFTYHFMFGPSVDGWPEAGCPGCSYTADSLDGSVVHLENRDVTFVAVSRAPLQRIDAYKRRMGWGFSLGFVRRERLQPRLRPVHRGGATNRQGVQTLAAPTRTSTTRKCTG